MSQENPLTKRVREKKATVEKFFPQSVNRYSLKVIDKVDSKNTFIQDFPTRVHCLDELVRLYGFEHIEHNLDKLLEFHAVEIKVESYGICSVNIAKLL